MTVLETTTTGLLEVPAIVVEPENWSGFPFPVSPSSTSTEDLFGLGNIPETEDFLFDDWNSHIYSSQSITEKTAFLTRPC